MMVFKYLGRILMVIYNNWISVVANVSKARKKWVWVSWILGR